MLKQNIFIEKSNIIHNNKYDYSLVHYIDCKTRVKIICPVHGEFEQTPNKHLRGSGCRKCYFDSQKSNTKEFIEKAEKIHGDKYDYSLVEYKHSNKKIKIICPTHGEFEQTPHSHLDNRGCSLCGLSNLNNNTFKEKSNIIHNNKYDYSLVEYVNYNTKVNIICEIHGIFKQSPHNHLKGTGCPMCNFDKTRSNNEDFIKKSKKIHGDKYDYSDIEYVNAGTKIKIICKKHGFFEQSPNVHLKGSGCGVCDDENRTSDKKYFIEKSKITHGDRYDYSAVEYKNNRTKVKIICPIHGEFEQLPFNHMNRNGCPECSESHGEKKISIILDTKNIKYVKQKKFDDCKYKNKLAFDFYLPDYNYCIEFDGIQHYEIVERWGGKEYFKKIQLRDSIKNEYCKNNNIKLFRISYKDNINEKLDLFFKYIF